MKKAIKTYFTLNYHSHLFEISKEVIIDELWPALKQIFNFVTLIFVWILYPIAKIFYTIDYIKVQKEKGKW